ncbi:MAG: stage II sporulation protein R [Eubacterium sp.]|nr:stage II sporulation protein R [Eubacterium sp.]
MTRKGKIAAIAVLFLFTGVLMVFYRRGVAEQRRQQDIAEEILRLHVVANSDSEEDQALKMEVKESIVTYLRGIMGDAKSVEEARLEIQKRLPEIEDLAREKMKMEGYDYEADAVLGKCYFPVKEYGDMTFPAGEYEALKVNLGKSAGKNWWCVMYPTLCFVDSTYQIVPETSKEKLKENLTEEEYNSLLDGGDNVQYSSRIIEWIQNVFP